MFVAVDNWVAKSLP